MISQEMSMRHSRNRERIREVNLLSWALRHDKEMNIVCHRAKEVR